MAIETKNGDDTVVPKVDRVTSAATDVPNVAPGRPQLADAEVDPVEGDQAVVTLDGMATGAIDSLQDIIDSGATVVV